MEDDCLAVLFGPGNWDCPWHQYFKCEVKELGHDALQFLHCTVGLSGTFHDDHGWMIDTQLWCALVKYIKWCQEEKVDFLFHVDKVMEGDEYYICLASTTMKKFGTLGDDGDSQHEG